MTQRFRSVWLAALGPGMVLVASASAADPVSQSAAQAQAAATPANREPARFGAPVGQPVAPLALAVANQQMADTIAEVVRRSGRLRQYTLDITFQDGTAEVTGRVADPTQRDEALRIVRGVPGVVRVRDLLTVVGTPLVPPQTLLQTQAQAPPPAPGPAPGPLLQRDGVPPLGPALPPEPAPIFQAGPSLPAAAYNPPPMPPYAWPTYAPFNNYSRVAYPTLYPYQAWPFIGPMYPFPKVPLGWRSVTLSWEDGHWWYARNATGHDWWRLRYW